MNLLPGVFIAEKKNGEKYYRASITYKNKHISLGSFHKEEKANRAYMEAGKIFADMQITMEDYPHIAGINTVLAFEKWVSIINFRDNGVYIKTPIYMKKNFFLYYLDKEHILKFAADDLFYYANHKIMKRGKHLFVSEFGMQTTIYSRYGIKNFAVEGRDFRFVNGDCFDFRYENIEIINKYYGVCRMERSGRIYYQAKIHINGDYIIGKYGTEAEAAVAYNKAAEYLMAHGVEKRYTLNYVYELSRENYEELYRDVTISDKIKMYC